MRTNRLTSRIIAAATLALLCWAGSPAVAQWDQAEAQKKRIVEIEKWVGPDHPDVATALNNLAELYRKQGRYAEVELPARRALTIREKAFGPDHPQVANSLITLVELYRNQGRYADAESLLRRALVIREKAFGSNHIEIVRVFNLLGLVNASQGRYVEAELFYKRALVIAEKELGTEHPNFAALLNNLGELYLHQGRNAEAEPLLKRSLAIREKVHSPDHPEIAVALNNLGELYSGQGRYIEAEPLYRRSLAIREKVYGPDNPEIASALNNLASLYYKQRRYADAEPLFKRALVIATKSLSPDHPNVALLLNNQAENYRNLGRSTDAEALYKRAIANAEKTLGPNHPETANLLNNLALLYGIQKRYAEAEPLLRRALTIRENVLGPNHPDLAITLNNLAEFYSNQRRYAESEAYFKRALAILEKALGPNHPEFANALNNLAASYLNQRRYGEALPLVNRLISERRAVKWTAFDVLLQARGTRLISPAQALTGSFEVVQRASSNAAAEATAKLAARFAAGPDTELAALVRKDQDLAVEAAQLDKTLIAAASKLPAERSAATEQKIRERIEVIKSEREKLQELFNERFPDYVALSKPQSVSVPDTQALLDDDEALIIFDLSDKSYAWIITRTETVWTELKITDQVLATGVTKLRKPMTDGQITSFLESFDTQLAYKLYQATFGALANKIVGKKRLSVITNGALTSLPLQLLVTNDPTGKKLKDVDWLVRSYAITVLPSVASLQILRGSRSIPSSATKQMVAFADPVFSKKAREQAKLTMPIALGSITELYNGSELDVAFLAEHLQQLPGTRREVEAISKALGVDESDMFLGMEATEAAVKQARLDQYRIVYFATHGLLAGDIAKFTKLQAEPALALTIPDKPNEFDNGLLQASEAAQLKLDANWVVLSACNTAAGDQPGAEALSGLARAFIYAGARSLIVSHWPVADNATAQLMSATFVLQSQRPELSHAEVLQQAMLQMLNNAKSDVEAHPRFWAPFIVVGEPKKRNFN